MSEDQVRDDKTSKQQKRISVMNLLASGNSSTEPRVRPVSDLESAEGHCSTMHRGDLQPGLSDFQAAAALVSLRMSGQQYLCHQERHDSPMSLTIVSSIPSSEGVWLEISATSPMEPASTASLQAEVTRNSSRNSNSKGSEAHGEQGTSRSEFGSSSTRWCQKLKEIFQETSVRDRYVFYPSKERFKGQLIPEKSENSYSFYQPGRGQIANVDENHALLSTDEQRMLAASGICEATYINLKTRLFACYQWRTLEDGHFYNKASAQQVGHTCVLRSSILYEWFVSLGLFNKVEYKETVPPRPENLGRLAKKHS